MAVQFYLDDTEDTVFHLIERLDRIPEPDDVVYLYDIDYKVERIETRLEDEEDVNPTSGGVAPWHLTTELYKVYLSLVDP